MGKSDVRRRVRKEAMAVCVLAMVLALALVWRGLARRGGGPSVSQGAGAGTGEGTEEEGELFEWKPGQFVRVLWGSSVSNDIDESRLADPYRKTAADLAAWAEMAWDEQWGYVWGTFGTVMDEELLAYKIQQYGSDVTDYEDVIRAKWLDRRTVDCAGLIKSYCWYDPYRQQISYGSGDMPDMGTDGFYDNAAEKGPIDTIPETPGLLVYAKGHIGVYVGDGWVVEAISHDGGVVKTRLADRTWTDWLECPYIQY